MSVRTRRSFGLPESWWYALRVSVYFGAAACGIVWLAWALRMPLEPDTVRRAIAVTPETLVRNPDTWSDGIVALPADALSTVRVQATGDPIDPWSFCTLADPLSFSNTKAFVESPDRLPGCRFVLDELRPVAWHPVSDRTSGDVAGQLSEPLPQLEGMRVLFLGQAATADVDGPVVLRVVRRPRLAKVMPQLDLDAAPAGSDRLLALRQSQAARNSASPRTRIAVAGTDNRVWLELPASLTGPEPGPIFAHAEQIDLDALPLDDILVSGTADSGVLLTYLPVRAIRAKLPRERRYNLFLAVSLILLGLLGLVHHIQSSNRAEVEDIVLYAAEADELRLDDEPVELPRVPADQVPPERAMNLVPRSRTLKDWVFATDADRRAFIRLCVVKWTGGADPEHLAQFHAFMTAAVAELLRDLGGDASGDTPSRQQAWMLWAPLLKNAAGVVVAGTAPDERPVLAAARYTTRHSPAFAAMMNARPLRWFVRVGAETIGITRHNKPASTKSTP